MGITSIHSADSEACSSKPIWVNGMCEEGFTDLLEKRSFSLSCWTLIREHLNSVATGSLLAIVRRGTHDNRKLILKVTEWRKKINLDTWNDIISLPIISCLKPSQLLDFQLKWGKKHIFNHFELQFSLTFNLKYVNDTPTIVDIRGNNGFLIG